MDNKKKLAAIIGVLNFLRAEKDKAEQSELYTPTLPITWASYGRGQIMANNQLMQRRVIRR